MNLGKGCEKEWLDRGRESVGTSTDVENDAEADAETLTAVPAGTEVLREAERKDDNTPPDGGYGWICCISCFFLNGFTWGVMASYGVYLSYYIDNNIFPGATAIDYAFIGGANFAAAMLIAPIMVWVVRLLGTRCTIMLGCLLYAGGFVAASFAKQYWQLALSQGVLVGLGVGTIWQPSVPILPQWFLRRRSLAQGIASAGSGIGGLIFSLATTPMIKRISLAWSLRITGLTTFTILMAAAAMIRDRNSIIRPKARPFDVQLLKRYQVWLLLGWGVFSIFGYLVLLYSLSSYAVAIGLTQAQGGIVIAMQNLGTAIGRPFLGVASDRWGRMTVAFAITAFTGIISFAIWIPATSYGVLLFFGLVSGATIGTFWATIAPLSGEVVDLKNLPSMLSLAWIFISLPCLFSEAIALEIRHPHAHRPYLYTQIWAGLCYMIAACCMLLLRRSKWGLWARERHK